MMHRPGQAKWQHTILACCTSFLDLITYLLNCLGSVRYLLYLLYFTFCFTYFLSACSHRHYVTAMLHSCSLITTNLPNKLEELPTTCLLTLHTYLPWIHVHARCALHAGCERGCASPLGAKAKQPCSGRFPHHSAPLHFPLATACMSPRPPPRCLLVGQGSGRCCCAQVACPRRTCGPSYIACLLPRAPARGAPFVHACFPTAVCKV